MESSNTSSSNSYQESFSSFINLPQPPPPSPPPPTTTTTTTTSFSSLQPPPPPPPSRPPNTSTTTKKRTRASRRAPTTILTTDTSNFRAMVQEFTGFPPPPFSSNPNPNSHLSSSFSLPPRIDLLPSSPYYHLSKLLDQRLLNAPGSASTSNYHFMSGGSNAHNNPPLDHLAPQFGGGDLGSLMTTTTTTPNINTSTSMQAMQSWDHHQDREREALILRSIPHHDEELIQRQKRLKTTQGMVESWLLHSSDD